ncbi:MAG: hypothetical protein WKG01_30590 [Kofleriaceae bacterium]
MDEFLWIRSLEPEPSGEQRVQRHAKRVKVDALIDRSVHPSGRLGSHTGERALHRNGGGVDAEKRRDPESCQSNAAVL